MKKDITDFTEDEFIAFMHKILAENVAPTDDVLDVLLGSVRKVLSQAPHSAGQ